MKQRRFYYVSGPMNGRSENFPSDTGGVTVNLEPDGRTPLTNVVKAATQTSPVAVYQRKGDLLVFVGVER